MLQGYLHSKIIASQNVSSKAQGKKIYVPFSRYSSFSIFNQPMIDQIYDITMSISTWARV